ncbi:MAG: lipid-A-disaccharide synthase [Elusimicrobia bacterium]|nr:lipid-A-disaccharide synthase [Elusimicrobiota bacterium]
MNTLLIVAGDPSGDLHGAALIRAFKGQVPELRVAAVGGDRMRREADEFLEDLASRGITGFWEPLLQLPRLIGLGMRIKRFLAAKRPLAVICVDYYGFNRRVLSLAREQRVPAYYFISPQVWASRPGRVRTLKRLIRRMFVIFPFEERLYQEAGVPVTFVGHPLLELLPEAKEPGPLTIPLELGLLPGSRASEIRRHLPIFLKAVRLLRRNFPNCRATIFAAPHLPDSAYPGARIAGAELVRESDYLRRRELHAAFCSSGTATLENALLGIPMAVVYRLSWLSYWIARSIIQVPHIAMCNILAGKRLAPELVQSEATPEKLAEAVVSLLESPSRYVALRQELMGLRQALRRPDSTGPAEGVASRILSDLGLVPSPSR